MDLARLCKRVWLRQRRGEHLPVLPRIMWVTKGPSHREIDEH
jgi:hypothetical protein